MDILERITEMITPLLEREGLSLYDITLIKGGGAKILRIYIDRPEGVSLEDCAMVSRHLSSMLDVEELITGSYSLEVSSPGLTRQLKKPDHFRKSMGKLARINFKKAFDGPRQVVGRLMKEKEEGVFIIVPEGNGEEISFAFEDVAKAKLEFEG